MSQEGAVCQARCEAQWREEPYICTLAAGHEGDVHEHSPQCRWSTTPDGSGWVHIMASGLGVVKIDM